MIFVVDDVVTIGETLAKLLQSDGYSAQAFSGAAARQEAIVSAPAMSTNALRSTFSSTRSKS